MSTSDHDSGAEVRTTRAPRFLVRLVFFVFAWIIVGICFIYGVRMWFNSNISPSFFPITGAAFCAAISFTLVLALEYVTGPIKLKFGGTEFEGASGPIVLWCLCFFVISFGLYMLGLADVVKSNNPPGEQKSIIQLFTGR
jgi:hypothetical protein